MRFNQTFSQLKSANKIAFVPFVTIGDPDIKTSLAIIKQLVSSGADALELGFPFSDPLLDGEVIQAANKRALDNGCKIIDCFKILQQIRELYPQIPISLLLSANLVYNQGLDNFYKKCQQVGVDAVLVADVPLLEAKPFIESANKYQINPVFICPPNANSSTINKIALNSQGYTYLVSRLGVTGVDSKANNNLHSVVKNLKQDNSPPILQGFGISEPKDVELARISGVDGVISGSAVVKIIADNLTDPKLMLTKLDKFIQTMQQAALF